MCVLFETPERLEITQLATCVYENKRIEISAGEMTCKKANKNEAICEHSAKANEHIRNWRRSHASETSTVAYLFAPFVPAK
eukprot:scaffold47322_cov68-Cyclotella_meneghiniana.AAC.1